jgi:hypothetical protein
MFLLAQMAMIAKTVGVALMEVIMNAIEVGVKALITMMPMQMIADVAFDLR